MTIKEYREKHKKCVYCKYCDTSLYEVVNYCHARREYILFKKAKAKKCPLYDLDWSDTE